MPTNAKYAGIAVAITNATLHQIGTITAHNFFPAGVVNGGAEKISIKTSLYKT